MKFFRLCEEHIEIVTAQSKPFPPPRDKENRPFGWPHSVPCARLLIMIVRGCQQAFQMNPIEPICIQN